MPKQLYDQYQSELTQGEEKPWYDFSDLPVWSGTLPGTPEDASHITTELAKDMSPVVGPYRSGVRSTKEYNKMMGLLDEGDYTGAISPAIWSLLESADVGLSALPILGGVLSTPIDLARAFTNLTPVRPVPKKIHGGDGAYLGPDKNEISGSFTSGRVNVEDGIKFGVGTPTKSIIDDKSAGKKVKVNLFKQKAGWKWIGEPPVDTPTIISVEQGNKHFYTLDSDIGNVDLSKYPNQKSEPRLRPSSRGELEFGEEVGKINLRGKEHPVYASIKIVPKTNSNPVAPVVKTTRPYKDPTGLLDFKKLDTDYPPVKQTREPLFVPQKKEISDELKIFKTKEQQEKLIDWFDEGVKTGGLAWYNTNPLRKYAISEFGNKKGLELYDRFLRYVGATSPNTNPMSNIKQASYYNYLDQQGVPIVDDLLTGNLKIPKGYGRMSLSGIKNTLASAGAGTKGPVLVGGKDIKLDRIPLYGHNYTGTFPATAPKVGRFYENLKGNIEQMATLDAGAMRAIAGKKGGKGKKAENLRESASKEIYDQMEVAFNKFANQLGVTPAQAQASIWSGSAPYTGVGKSTGDLPLGATFMEMLMEKVSQTARITGQSPKDVLSGLLSGNQYLKGIIAPFAVTGGLSGLLSEQEM
tara:strand:+ start:824 stop:2734 length:1911 start_codon:yes stop_codon:yes gene_type:complete